MQTEQTDLTIVITAMDVYLFDLEHLNTGQRSVESDIRSFADGDPYDLAELNRMVSLDMQRRAELN